MFGLADCNNFFVSCERTRNPRLIGRPVVVLSNNDGCVVARSNEAKAAGVKMGQPAFQIKDEIRSGKIIALSGDHLFYRDLSLKVHDIFRRYAPRTIDYSIDEAFLDMTGIPLPELKNIGNEIARTCLAELGLPVTIGFAPTKTLAKIVTEACKKKGRPVGLLARAGDIIPYLKKVSIADLWGVGRRLNKKLYSCGVFTIYDFACKDRHWVRSIMGVTGERSWMEIHGESCIELDFTDRKLQDSISESRTFPEDITDFDYIRARIAIYSADCAAKLRKMDGVCRQVGVFLSTNPFREDISRRTLTLSTELPDWSDDSLILVNTSIALLENLWEDIPFKRGGVWFSDIRAKSGIAPNLFEEMTLPDHSRLMKAVDSINISPGKTPLKLASQITMGRPGHNDGYSSSFQAPKK